MHGHVRYIYKDVVDSWLCAGVLRARAPAFKRGNAATVGLFRYIYTTARMLKIMHGFIM